MRLKSLLLTGVSFAAAAALSLVVAKFALDGVESSTEFAVRASLDSASFDWAEVTADGLRVILEGTAPDEAARFAAASEIGKLVDVSRIIDQMAVVPSKGIAPPQFSAEILRNDAGISVIGLVPASTNRDAMVADLHTIAGSENVADFLEPAAYAAPRGWSEAMEFGMEALKSLPRAKISVTPHAVAITAITESTEAKSRLERRLNRMTPAGLHLTLDIAAPRPVITPFTLRYSLTENGGQFDACSAETEASRARILRAAQSAGLTGQADCTIGMGVPSPNWARAVELSLAKLAELGSGTVTLANADITLVATQGTSQAAFDRAVGELENSLPNVFALHAILPETQEASEETPEFSATLSPEGQVQLRGRVADSTQSRMTNSFAQARFGTTQVHNATRQVDDLPADWAVRILAAMQALSMLERGSVTVLPDSVTIRGMSYRKDASAAIARLFSERLGQAESYELAITYEEPPLPEDQPLTPETCARALVEVQSDAKITFEPGSATVATGSKDTLDQIADILKRCGELKIEIQGHTDSQGREAMNQELSQTRAESVLNALRARRVPTLTYEARGYGEVQPIADNNTAEGREANRRIEFKLIQAEEPATPPDTTALEATDQ